MEAKAISSVTTKDAQILVRACVCHPTFIEVGAQWPC